MSTVATRIDPLQELDARVRILAAVLFSVVVVSLSGWPALAAALALSAGLVVLFRCGIRATVRRLIAIDGVLILVVLTLPFAEAGVPAFAFGPFVASEEGLARAAGVVIKANAVALVMFALIGSLDVVRFARGLAGLRVPAALIDLMILTARYIDVLGRERQRLSQAMTARAFRARSDVRTWQALGWLVGMLLVRAFDRAERVWGAMRCRGFRTTLLFADDAAALSARDIVFAAAIVLAIVGLLGLDRT
jgi:cobalt/nickel transport system permease protein